MNGMVIIGGLCFFLIVCCVGLLLFALTIAMVVMVSAFLLFCVCVSHPSPLSTKVTMVLQQEMDGSGQGRARGMCPPQSKQHNEKGDEQGGPPLPWNKIKGRRQQSQHQK